MATDTERILKALEANWQEEKTGELTYRALAEREDDEHRKKVLLGIAVSEMHHAARWARRIKELGGEDPQYKGSPNGSADQFANRVGGQDAAIRRVELEERRHVGAYGRQLKELGDGPSVAILESLREDERQHSKLLKDLFRPVQGHQSALDRFRPRDAEKALKELRAKRGGKSPASWIGDAIYGVNDGLGAIFGIVSGVSGATLGDRHDVLIAGLAGMIASALSMGSGAYLAAKSEREIYEAEVQRKRKDIEADPEGGKEEMSLIYQVKGVPEEDARKMAEHLAKDPEQFLKTLASEELNLTEEALSNPITSAISGSISTAVGAFVPIIPFFFIGGLRAVIVAAVISLAAHFAVGAAKTLITVRSWWSSGLEMTAVGAVEGVVTYGIGIGLGQLHVR
jgi:VIT1/CCC1 family predicted Fe2+/Mn2+ transporter/rubrerythrin